MPEQDKAEVPDPLTLVGPSVQVRPVIGLTADASPTKPLKPLRALTVIVEFPATPALTVAAVGPAETVKS